MSRWVSTLVEILVDPKKRKVLREQLREYSRAVAAGADPIEALRRNGDAQGSEGHDKQGERR